MAPDHDTKKELEEISPFLSGLPKSNPYTVPPGYFEQFPSIILIKAKQGRVIRMAPKRFATRLAVAATIAGAVVAGSWFFMQKKAPADSFAVVEKQMQQVSDTEMAAYVNGNAVMLPDDLSSSAPIKAEDVPLVLADVSDQELQQYIDQHSPSPALN